MIPLKPPLSPIVIEIFNGLIGVAREKAIASRNYDELIKQPEREPSEE